MEDHISRLFDLIASKAYESLSTEEKAFVEEHSSQQEYEMQRSIIAAADDLQYPIANPVPLEVESKKPGFLMRSIPLYQVLAIAACLLAGIFIFNGRSTLNVRLLDTPFNVSFTGPNEVSSVIHDTVIKEVKTAKTAVNYAKPVVDTVYVVQIVDNAPSTRMLEPGNGSANVNLTEKPKQNAGVSSKKDKTTNLLPASQTSASMK